MAKISPAYLEKISKHIFLGTALQHTNMTAEQKLRTQIVYEAYQVWMSNKQIQPHDICRRIAARIYSQMLAEAARNPQYAAQCQQLHIVEGKPRTFDQLANDVATFDYLVGQFNTPTLNIEKAKVIDASDYLINEGKRSGNDRSVTAGAKLKMELYKGFDERQQGFENVANIDIAIVGDPSLIKAGAVPISEEEKNRLRKKYGGSEREIQELIQNNEGTYEAAPTDPETPHDIFTLKEDIE